MTSRNLFLVLALGAGFAAGSELVAPSEAFAQSNTAGAIQGVVTDAKTGDGLVGVTVVITSPTLAQSQTAITDDKGFYKVTDLPPGVYLVEFFYADIDIKQTGVNVGVNKVTPVYQKVDQAAAGGEKIVVHAKAPLIDPTSTTQGITIDKNYMQNIPVPGRTFDAVLGAAAGSQGDSVTGGVSFSGSSSLENQYYVDGVSTTGLTYGTVGSPIVNDFIQEIDVITGGYNAEYGRSTGGIVTVVTKTGSNEVKGSVFGYYQPGFLTAAVKTSPINATSIDFKADTNYDADFGFEIGGPIIKDKLWYFVGFDPTFQRFDYTRITKSQTDCRAPAGAGVPQGRDIPGLSDCNPMLYRDGKPDVDPRTGFYITDQLDSEVRPYTQHTYNLLAKLNYAATPEHQGQLSFSALPNASRTPGLNGPAQNGYQTDGLTTDLSAKWTSKFNDNKTEVEAIVGWHREEYNSDALAPQYEQQPIQDLLYGNLYTWGSADWGSGGPAESAATLAGCKDDQRPTSTTDKYPLITNCPMDTRDYIVGGPGYIARNVAQRREAEVTVTERFKWAGSHEVKAGIDGESDLTNQSRLYSGGKVITNFVAPGQIYVDRYVALGGQIGAVDNPDPSYYDQECANGKIASFYCAYLSGVPGSRGTAIQSNTLNWAAFARDSWQIRPNLTLNYGLRYEEQRLRYASFLQHTTDPLTGEKLGTNALTLTGMISPRIGLLYDWTKEGRSKIYAHWGRFYESVPMDINDRSFGGEVYDRRIYSASKCGPDDLNIGGPNGQNCPYLPPGSPPGTPPPKPDTEQLLGASGVLVAPGIQAQYMDEFIAGVEYEILDDLKIGVSFQNRNLGRVIEDVSTDGAQTYIIANPGEWSSSDEAAFEQRIMRTDDPAEKQRLTNELNLYRGIRTFDKPRRDYNALQFTIERRFSKALYVQGSYTYSRNLGNYPGLVSYDNGQVDPNISSQYDLIELLANHVGPLPLDRPHYIKLDGYYTFDFKRKGALTLGIRFRALSGTPENALAGHWLYGPDESFLLPRGELGRSDFDHGLDLHVGYKKALTHGMAIELLADIYNVYNRQGTADVDNTYAQQVSLAGNIQNANPISGGTYDDLIWAKALDKNGAETSIPLGRNPNFHNTIARYAPAYVRFGMRLTF